MVTFIFKKPAEKRFKKLPPHVQERILERLRVLKEHPDIFLILKRLNDFEPATHRLRVGTYRLILELKKNQGENLIFSVLDVGHRRDIYK